MGKPTGFKEFERKTPVERPIVERIKDYKEVYRPFHEDKLQEQAARCMNCGVPFCHIGCPLGNIIPEFNDLAYKGHWKKAWEMLSATNNFPEFTGRLCPAPCEEACVLGINEPPVTIENIEKEIIEKADKHQSVQYTSKFTQDHQQEGFSIKSSLANMNVGLSQVSRPG